MVTNAIGTLTILLATTDIISQDICLGHFEYHYDKPGGNQVCARGWLILRIWCWINAFAYLSIASNIPESYMLYYCFKAIQQQTEKSRQSIGQESYSTRKRYFLKFLSSPSILRMSVASKNRDWFYLFVCSYWYKFF